MHLNPFEFDTNNTVTLTTIIKWQVKLLVGQHKRVKIGIYNYN